MQQLTGQAFIERYGHAWDSPELARDYVERTDRAADERTEGFKIMTGLVPFAPSHPIRILDIGTGQGAVAAVLLDAFPRSVAVGLDVSEPMKAIAEARMARYDDRFSYRLGDFLDGDIPAETEGSFDVAVSSKAVHHLPAANKQALYRSIYRALSPGGCFFNLDAVAPNNDYLRARYRTAGRALRGLPLEESPDRANRPPMPGHYYDTAEDHMQFLEAAGFESVDCFWKRLGQTLIGGYKRA